MDTLILVICIVAAIMIFAICIMFAKYFSDRGGEFVAAICAVLILLFYTYFAYERAAATRAAVEQTAANNAVSERAFVYLSGPAMIPTVDARDHTTKIVAAQLQELCPRWWCRSGG